jgi:hypothetical protein
MKICMLSFLFVLSVSLTVFSQDDDTIQYIHGLPETGEDTAQQIITQDFAPADSVVEVSVEQIPQALFKTLSEGPQYAGWQNHIIQLDKNTELYWLHIRSGRNVRSYGFSPNGKPVSYRETTLKE